MLSAPDANQCHSFRSRSPTFKFDVLTLSVLRHHCATMSHQNHRERREPQYVLVPAKVLLSG